MSNHPEQVTPETAEELRTVCRLLEVHGPLAQQHIRELLKDKPRTYARRALQVLSYWNLISADRAHRTWELTEENWRESIGARIIEPSDDISPRLARERFRRRIRNAILQALNDAGELTESELSEAIGMPLVPVMFNLLVAHGAIGIGRRGDERTFYSVTRRPIDSITSSMAALAAGRAAPPVDDTDQQATSGGENDDIT